MVLRKEMCIGVVDPDWLTMPNIYFSTFFHLALGRIGPNHFLSKGPTNKQLWFMGSASQYEELKILDYSNTFLERNRSQTQHGNDLSYF